MYVSKFAPPVPPPSAAPIAPRTSRRLPRWLTIWLAFLGSIAVVVGGGAYALARSGFVEVPLLSRYVNHVGEVPRPVEMKADTLPLAEAFSLQFDSALRAYQRSRTEEARKFTVRLSEASVTKTVQAALVKQGAFDGFGTVKQAQVVFQPKEVALYVVLLAPEGERSMLIAGEPRVVDGAPGFRLTKVHAGRLPLPVMVAQVLLGRMIESQLEQVRGEIGAYVQLQDISVEDGAMTVRGLFQESLLQR